MTKAKTRVNKRTRVSKQNGGAIFNIPTPPPAIIGYIVRYEQGGASGGPSDPLHYSNEYGAAVLLINGEGNTGTIFPSWDAATDAVIHSVQFQIKNSHHWNEMYGDYLIDPVIAA